MKAEFHIGNRERLYDALPENTLVLAYSGKSLRKTGDEYYPFYAHRNFVYLTGLDREGFIFMAVKHAGVVMESIYIQPKYFLVERWTGARMSPEEVTEQSGIREVLYLSEFKKKFDYAMHRYGITSFAMDLYKEDMEDQDTQEIIMSEKLRHNYPGVSQIDIMPIMRKLRVIKQPCEIEAMRKAAKITREGIMAMMRNCHPGMYEYQLKAEYDRALTWNGVLSPGFPSIISSGENNFCIHYYSYKGQVHDGDMVLNDVAACYDNCTNDVSRGWPANGKFNERQKALYMAAYRTSEHLFSIIKPGMPMRDVDCLARVFCCEELKQIGLVEKDEEISKYMWHGGSHHIGYDVHDQVDAEGRIRAGMVFCVDIGIYVEEWGIGFRLEDNCLVTEDGCENLTAAIPRTIEEIESYMARFDHSPIENNLYDGGAPVDPERMIGYER